MVLVTGGSGLVGGHLLIHLLKQNKTIRALKRETSTFKEFQLICAYYQMDFEWVISQIEWVVGDLLDESSLDKALTDITTVYHCAAVVSFGSCSPEVLTQTNIKGTRHLIQAAIKHHVSCFAFVSSIGALGQSVNDMIVTEETPYNSNNTASIYSNSKYLAEQEVWKAPTEGLPVVIVNPGIILGAGDFTKGSLQFFSQVKKGMLFYTKQISGYVDVRDVCRALTTLVEKKVYNQRFILVSENLSNQALFTLIARSLHKKPPYILIGRKGLWIAEKIGKVFARITGKAPILTPEIISSATKQERYSADKIKKEIDFMFIPMKDTVDSAVNFHE